MIPSPRTPSKPAPGKPKKLTQQRDKLTPRLPFISPNACLCCYFNTANPSSRTTQATAEKQSLVLQTTCLLLRQKSEGRPHMRHRPKILHIVTKLKDKTVVLSKALCPGPSNLSTSTAGGAGRRAPNEGIFASPVLHSEETGRAKDYAPCPPPTLARTITHREIGFMFISHSRHRISCKAPLSPPPPLPGQTLPFRASLAIFLPSPSTFRSQQPSTHQARKKSTSKSKHTTKC